MTSLPEQQFPDAGAELDEAIARNDFSTPRFTTSPIFILDAKGYEALGNVLYEAFHQAASGKGKERHAQPYERFEDQVILQGAKRFGTGALLFQAFKKSEESQRLPQDAGVRELLGAIVYLAAAVIARRNTGV